MNTKPVVKWGLMAMAVLILAFLLLPPIPKTKVKPLRINSVNTVQNVTFDWPGTNSSTSAAASPSK